MVVWTDGAFLGDDALTWVDLRMGIWMEYRCSSFLCLVKLHAAFVLVWVRDQGYMAFLLGGYLLSVVRGGFSVFAW